ncbi:MAG: MmcQ/YjbR family DNA-binding protein [Caulobacteraceae bacterium]
MTAEEMREICLSFPGAVEGKSYGAPAFLVNKKFFTRLRRDDGSAVLMEVGFDEREMLMEAEPETFHFTAHYKDYPCVLARIATLHPGSFRNFLERRWRKIAPKAAIRAWDAAKAS